MLTDLSGSSLGSVLVYQPHGSWNFKARREVRRVLATVIYCWSTVQLISWSVMSHCLRPHGLQLTRLLCPPLTPGVCSNSYPLSQWCHPSISSFVTPLLLLPSVFPSIRVFSNKLALCIRWLKCWSFSSSISPSNEYSVLISFRIDWLDLLAVLRILKTRAFSRTPVRKHQLFSAQPSL